MAYPQIIFISIISFLACIRTKNTILKENYYKLKGELFKNKAAIFLLIDLLPLFLQAGFMEFAYTVKSHYRRDYFKYRSRNNSHLNAMTQTTKLEIVLPETQQIFEFLDLLGAAAIAMLI